MLVDTVRMSKKKNNNHEHYRKPVKAVRIRLRLYEQAEKLADILEQTVSQVINDALRIRLEQAELWPPKDGDNDDS